MPLDAAGGPAAAGLAPISLLSATDAGKLRSLELIVDISACVQQLVENSFDAGATSIEVRIDCSKFSISVLDNGRGISTDDLRNIGVRYCTSKDMSRGAYGFRGEALHSIAMLSSVFEVQTRANGSMLVATKIMSGGCTLSTTVNDALDGQSGTSVFVRELFHEWPIRRQSSRHRVQHARVRELLQRMSLLNYSTHVSLIDAERGKLVWQVRQSQNLLARVCEVRGKGLETMHTVSHERGSFRVDGVVALVPRGPTKALAELFVNKRPLPATSDLVNLLTTVGPDGPSTLAAPTARKEARALAPHVTQQYMCASFVLHLQCPPEDCDVLFDPDKSNVVLSDSVGVRIMLLEAVQLVAQQESTSHALNFLKSVETLLESLRSLTCHIRKEHVTLPLPLPSISSALVLRDPITQGVFLSPQLPHQFYLEDAEAELGRLADSRVNRLQSSPGGTVQVFPTEPDVVCSVRFPRSPDPLAAFHDAYFGDLAPSPAITVPTTLCVAVRNNDRTSVESIAISDMFASSSRLSFGSSFFAGGPTPTSERVVPFSLGARRTMCAEVSSACLNLSASLAKATASTETTDTTTPDAASSGGHVHAPEGNETNSLKKNDLDSATTMIPSHYAQTSRQAIPYHTDEWDAGESLDFGRFRAAGASTTFSSIMPSHNAPTHSVRVTKDMLRRAQTISQVACKFIIARAGSSLICIDQHAADERVQLEFLEQKTYGDLACGMHAGLSALDPPVVVAFSSHELSLLELYSPALEKYGFKFSVVSASSDVGSAVSVQSVPVVLGVTLSVDDMLGILHQLWEYDPSAVGLQVKPSVIQYILCSKACRGAIMFGDTLAQGECTELLKKLARCELPFNCAHGRPSSTVLVDDIGDLASQLADRARHRKRSPKKPRLESIR